MELRLSCTNPLISDDSTYHTDKFCFLLLNGRPEHWIHVSGLSVGVSVVTRPSLAPMDHMQHFYQMIYFKALLAFQGHFYSIIDFVLFCNRWWNWSINQSNTAIHIIYSNQLQGRCINDKLHLSCTNPSTYNELLWHIGIQKCDLIRSSESKLEHEEFS